MSNLFTMDLTSLGSESKIPSKISTTGKFLLFTTGGVGVALTVICVPFVSPALRRHCLPYVPATNEQVGHVLRALRNGSGNSCIDIGSGDGRLVVAAAQAGFTAHGVEINPWLVAFSRVSSYYHKVQDKTRFYRKDLWKLNLQPYNNIIIFGVEQMMEDFEKKVLSEAREGSTVVACRFPLPGLVPCETIGHGVDTVWRYKLSKNASELSPSCEENSL